MCGVELSYSVASARYGFRVLYLGRAVGARRTAVPRARSGLMSCRATARERQTERMRDCVLGPCALPCVGDPRGSLRVHKRKEQIRYSATIIAMIRIAAPDRTTLISN